jgi:hypothetical protein
MPKGMIDVYVLPPHSPDDCIFAKTTACVSSNFEKPITPCQFGGNPDCANCGCIASAALAAWAATRCPAECAWARSSKRRSPSARSEGDPRSGEQRPPT